MAFNILRPSTWHPSMAWMAEFDWGDFFGGVQEDFVEGTQNLAEAAKSTLKGVRSILTPSVIWIVVIALVGLIILTQFKKVLRT